MRHTKLAGLMGPAEKMARVAADAQNVARRALTRRSGTVVVPNGDGTSTVIGPGAGDTDGQSNGVAQWVGDTTPPGRPIGMAASSAWGVLYVTWGGELEGGMPPDFAYCAVLVDGGEKARMAERGTAAIEGLEPGAVTVTMVAYDAARDMDGNLAPNASQPSDAVAVEVVDERAEIDEAVQEAKDAADAMAGQITEVTTKVEGLEGELDHVSTQVTGAVEDADAALTAATEAKQDIDGFKTAVSQTYETKADADAAMAQEVLDRNSAIEQSASSILSTVSQTYVDKATGETFATKTEVHQTADSIEQTVAATYQPKGDYLTESDASATYATKSQLTQTAESITATVTEVSQTADAAMSKATEVEQTASGLSATVTQVSQTASAAQQAADDAAQDAAEAAGIAEGKSDVLIQDAEPPASMRKATTLWIDTTGGANTPKRWTGAAWQAVTDKAATDAAGAAAQAQADADAAQDAADGAVEQVATLKVTVDGIETSVGVAQETAEGAASAASQAQQTATQLQTTVTRDYLSKADASKTYATQSQLTQTADGIRSEVSETYQTKAGMSAYATSSSVEQTAESIMSEVATEYQTKDGMSSYATKSYVDQQDDSITSTVSSVQQTAQGALEKATTVEQTAEGLEVTLNQTTQTANAAQSAASAAQSAASAAQTAASGAQSTANTASSTANSALSAANTAQDAAEDAAKTATNFLKFDSSGLCVGDQTAGTLGANALIAPNAYSLRKGSTVLSRFSENAIDLGMNSKNSSIEMCGGSATIMSDSSGDVTIKAVGRSEDAGNSNSLNLYGGGCRVSLQPNMIGTGGANGIDIDANFLDFGGSNRGFSTGYGSHYISTSDAFDVLYEALNPTSVRLTPNKNLANYNSYTNSSVRFGNLLILQCSIALSTATNWNAAELTLFTLPAGQRPSAERTLQRSALVITNNGANVFVRTIKVRTDGAVRFVNDGSTSNVARVLLPGIVVRM